MSDLCINLGGYKNFKNYPQPVQDKWKILDTSPGADYQHDLTKIEPFPFKNNSVKAYYCSMIFEHLFPTEINHCLNELKRTLVPGGKIRVVVPDMAIAIKKYTKDPKWLFSGGLPAPVPESAPTAMGRLSAWVSSMDRGGQKNIRGHKTAFDAESLIYFVKKAGFDQVQILSCGKGTKELKALDFPRYKGYSLYLEATK